MSSPTIAEFEEASRSVDVLIFAGHDLRLAGIRNDLNHVIRTLQFGIDTVSESISVIDSVSNDLNLHAPDRSYSFCRTSATNVHVWSIGNFCEIHNELQQRFCDDPERDEWVISDLHWPHIRQSLATLPAYDPQGLQLVLWNERSFVVDQLKRADQDSGQREMSTQDSSVDDAKPVGNVTPIDTRTEIQRRNDQWYDWLKSNPPKFKSIAALARSVGPKRSAVSKAIKEARERRKTVN